MAFKTAVAPQICAMSLKSFALGGRFGRRSTAAGECDEAREKDRSPAHGVGLLGAALDRSVFKLIMGSLVALLAGFIAFRIAMPYAFNTPDLGQFDAGGSYQIVDDSDQCLTANREIVFQKMIVVFVNRAV